MDKKKTEEVERSNWDEKRREIAGEEERKGEEIQTNKKGKEIQKKREKENENFFLKRWIDKTKRKRRVKKNINSNSPANVFCFLDHSGNVIFFGSRNVPWRFAWLSYGVQEGLFCINNFWLHVFGLWDILQTFVMREPLENVPVWLY